MTDTERLNALQDFIAKEPLTLWLGVGEFPKQPVGISLLSGDRTLREALDQCLLSREEQAAARKGKP